MFKKYFFTLFLLIQPVLYAQTNNNKTIVKKNTNISNYKIKHIEVPSFSSLMIKTFFILIIFSVGLYFIYKYVKNKNIIPNNNNEIISDLATYSFPGKNSLKIIKVVNSYYLLGVSDSNINLITQIDNKEIIDKINLEHDKEISAKGRSNFKNILGKYFNFSNKSSIEVTKNLKDKIRKL